MRQFVFIISRIQRSVIGLFFYQYFPVTAVCFYVIFTHFSKQKRFTYFCQWSEGKNANILPFTSGLVLSIHREVCLLSHWACLLQPRWGTHSPIFGSKPETWRHVGFCLKFQSQRGVYYPFPQIQHAVKHESESDKLLPRGSCVSWLVNVIKQG